MSKDGALGTELISFCRNIPYSPEKLLRKAYGIRNFRSVEMDRLFIKTEMYLKSKTAAVSSMPHSSSMGPRSRSSEVLPSNHSQNTIQMISHTLAIREVISFLALSLFNLNQTVIYSLTHSRGVDGSTRSPFQKVMDLLSQSIISVKLSKVAAE